jgi:(p)ppGpp synthase/HD superfamily hydrolase
MMNLAYQAMVFAREVHKDQRRKYTNAPYFDHLAEVAGIVSSLLPDISGGRSDIEYILAVAYLHDCVEDQNVSKEFLLQKFGPIVTEGVMLLSDLEEGNRATRKRLSRERLATAPGWVQTIKCADLISNTSSIVQHDKDFAKVYLQEKQMLLGVLTKADHRLRAIAFQLANDGLISLSRQECS